MMDLFAGYTITQRIRFLHAREEWVNRQREKVAELPISEKGKPCQ